MAAVNKDNSVATEDVSMETESSSGEKSASTKTVTDPCKKGDDGVNSNKADASKNGEKNIKEVADSGPSEELCIKIRNQIEYYFGNYNLPRDKFLSEQVKIDDGWIPMEVMTKFKRLSDLSTEYDTIFKALKDSQIIETDEKKNKIRRTPKLSLPLYNDDIKEDTVKRTIYCKGFPRDGTTSLDMLLDFFKPYGPYETVHMRNFYDKVTKKSGFKGSVLVVFPDHERAQLFMKHDDVQYKRMPILRKWYADYKESKRLEFEERKSRKEQRLKQLEKEGTAANEIVGPLPKGTWLHLSGFIPTTSRDDIKGAMLEIIDDVAFIEFNSGNTEGYVRLSTHDSNKQAAEALQGKLKVNEADITVRIVEGEEEDELIKKAQIARSKALSGGSNKRKKSGGRGGRGGKRNFNKRKKF